jgi:peptidoglycan hydrolase-like protein with peptidoglycan-binding domain
VLEGTVREVQELLAEIAGAGDTAMSPGAVDGVFGPRTEQAVIEFQRRGLDATGTGLVADGIVGPLTIMSMRVVVYLLRAGGAATAPPVTLSVPPLPFVLRPGMNGSWVWRLQQRLADRGWAVTVDGDYGPETTTVVVAFQREKGLTADGEVFTVTWGALWAAPVT